jgi:hypothetical protein
MPCWRARQGAHRGGARGGDTLLFFYYSGHADDRAIFPKGPDAAVQRRSNRGSKTLRAKLRVGLVDSCRGGSWTAPKV